MEGFFHGQLDGQCPRAPVFLQAGCVDQRPQTTREGFSRETRARAGFLGDEPR
jgi:hypothetical protein